MQRVEESTNLDGAVLFKLSEASLKLSEAMGNFWVLIKRTDDNSWPDAGAEQNEWSGAKRVECSRATASSPSPMIQ